jgi:hypothetical protein
MPDICKRKFLKTRHTESGGIVILAFIQRRWEIIFSADVSDVRVDTALEEIADVITETTGRVSELRKERAERLQREAEDWKADVYHAYSEGVRFPCRTR